MKRGLLLVLLLLLVSAYAPAAFAAEDPNPELAAVRKATARYQRLDVALADGFQQLFECISHPTEGAMGVHYVVHAWIWRHNPSGMFADWNPNVKCP
jgi:hypothetical protein